MHVSNFDEDSVLRKLHKGCKVLVVDDDPACLDEYRETISNLGYTIACASNAPDALKQIAESPEIGVVITDIEMPSMNGISLLSEIANRFSPNRPIVTLVITAHSTLQVATMAMQSQATDMLSKPVIMADLAAALRRATAHHFTMSNRFQITALTNRLDPPVFPSRGDRPDGPPTGPEIQDFIQMLLKFQRNKSKFFDPRLLSGPSWDIFLDIAEASLRAEPIPTSSASATTQVPLSTALRHVNNLVSAGLVRAWTDPADKRRTLLELEPHALAAMQRYLETAWKFQSQAI